MIYINETMTVEELEKKAEEEIKVLCDLGDRQFEEMRDRCEW